MLQSNFHPPLLIIDFAEHHHDPSCFLQTRGMSTELPSYTQVSLGAYSLYDIHLVKYFLHCVRAPINKISNFTLNRINKELSLHQIILISSTLQTMIMN